MILSYYLTWMLFLVVQDICHGQPFDDYDYIDENADESILAVDGKASKQTDQQGTYISQYDSDNYLTSSTEPLNLSGSEKLPRKITKRGTWNRTDRNWQYDIPVVINDTLYTGNAGRLKRALKYISSRVCVRFHDVTHTWDTKNPSWFTSNGFKTNSYVRIRSTSGCVASMGQGTKGGPKDTYPCNDFNVNLHEMFHTLGVFHTQKLRDRSSHITIHFDNISKKSQMAYRYQLSPEVISYGFDPRSVMLYGRTGFGSNGLETYTFVRDDARYFENPASHEHIVFLELNKIYRCNELFCNNDQTDCSPGYHARVNGACRCVCPDDLDPTTNCKELINKLVLLEANGCPDEFEQNVRMLPLTGFAQPLQDPVAIPIPSKNFTLQLPICMKRTPTDPAANDWLSWPPGGDYCILQKRKVPCGGAFKGGSLQITTTKAESFIWGIGATDVIDKTVTMKFCCQNEDPANMVVDLPNSHAFRWIAYDSCPAVRGMAVTKGKITISTKKLTASGSLPPHHVYKSEKLDLFQCLYIPPVYGCNQVITLDSNTRSVRVTTPGFGIAREPNRRCFYAFKNPQNSRLRLTFNKYDLHEEDKFLVKKYNQWLDATRIKNYNFPHQIVSVNSYLSLEYWSSWEVTTHLGVNFTVDLLPGEEFCYDLLRNGEDYLGDKSVSETYEECLPWEAATACDEFPFDDPSLLASGNKCRNPEGKLDQPWCYTFINGSECHKRYCDVCNIKTPVDILDNCTAFLAADPSFCGSAVQRFGCFKTCGFPLQTYAPAKCGKPKFPLDGVAVNVLSKYKQGDKITVKCKSSTLLTNQITCTKNGWTKLTSACIAANCRDELSTCEDILTAFPNFCVNSHFSTTSRKSCSKSCGQCSNDIKCMETVNKNYRRKSTQSAIKPGDVMNFTCDPKLYHVGGDLQRACSASGKLLGAEPKCSTNPVAQDIKLETVRDRMGSLSRGLAILLDYDGYRIPFSGKVTKWYYYCYKAGPLTFLVYRKTGKNYRYIGSNKITCVPDWKMEYRVPADDQISVSQGDVYGVFTETSDVLRISKCKNKILQLPSTKSKSVSELTKSSQTFSDLVCAVPSLGLRVKP